MIMPERDVRLCPSRWAHDAVYHDLALRSVRVEMIAVVAAMLALP
jgi:hypothetical protein